MIMPEMILEYLKQDRLNYLNVEIKFDVVLGWRILIIGSNAECLINRLEAMRIIAWLKRIESRQCFADWSRI